MGVPIEVWVETIKRHPVKYKFKGLDGEGDRSAHGFFTDVREAAVCDAAFMERYLEQEQGFFLECLEEALASEAPDVKTGLDDDDVESYARFLRRRLWHRWTEEENILHASARKVVRLLDTEGSGGALRCEWAGERVDPHFAWGDIRGQEPEWLLGEHPPEAMWSHAYEQGVDLEDVMFVCPGCHREPVREKDVDRDPVRFYCGLCGAEACPDEGHSLEDWAEAVGVKLWPFRQSGA